MIFIHIFLVFNKIGIFYQALNKFIFSKSYETKSK